MPRKPAGKSAGPQLKGANPSTPPTHEARVRYVMGEIAAGRWESDGSSATLLAMEWGAGKNTIARCVGEAQRRVAAVDDGEYVRVRLCAALDEVLDVAKAMIIEGDPKALSGFASIARTWSDIAGTRPKGAGDGEAPVFRVELVGGDRPPASPSPPASSSDPCPPSGNSSPPEGAPAPP